MTPLSCRLRTVSVLTCLQSEPDCLLNTLRVLMTSEDSTRGTCSLDGPHRLSSLDVIKTSVRPNKGRAQLQGRTGCTK